MSRSANAASLVKMCVSVYDGHTAIYIYMLHQRIQHDDGGKNWLEKKVINIMIISEQKNKEIKIKKNNGTKFWKWSLLYVYMCREGEREYEKEEKINISFLWPGRGICTLVLIERETMYHQQSYGGPLYYFCVYALTYILIFFYDIYLY